MKTVVSPQGLIIRVSNKDASRMVNQREGYRYTTKSAWKKQRRKEKQA